MLRVLATWDPEELPLPSAQLELEEEAALGLLPDEDAADWFAASWDRREDFEGTDVDLGAIRETSQGIQCRRHPEAMLRDSPELWDVVAMWRSGVERELSREDYATLTNFEVECWLVLCAAHGRELERRIRARREESEP